MPRRKMLAALVMLTAAAAAGCDPISLALGIDGPSEPNDTLTVSYLPYVAVGGTSPKIEPGFGVKLGSGGSHVMSEEEESEGSVGFQGYFAWSHHGAAPGRPEADYLRLETAMIFSGYWTGRESTSVRLGFDVDVGLTLHGLIVDGLDGVTGIGPSGSAALRLRLGRHAYLTAGVDLDFWLSTEGDLAATIAPFARFGVRLLRF